MSSGLQKVPTGAGRLARIACGLLACAALLAHGAHAAEAGVRPSERLALIKQRGTLIVGVKTDYAPFGMLTAAGVLALMKVSTPP